MKPMLQLRVGQSLNMTPQLQQAIRLLQLSSLDLQSEIQQNLDSNPMLELTENDAEPSVNAEADAAETAQKNESESAIDNSVDLSAATEIQPDLPVDTQWDDIYQSSSPSSSGLSRSSAQDNSDFESNAAADEDLQKHLSWQSSVAHFNPKDELIAEAIIESIDEQGYLQTSCQEILDTVNQQLKELLPADELELLNLDEIEVIRHRIQQFDPIGCASIDLRDCLMVQLKRLDSTIPSRADAINIVDRYMKLLGSRDYRQLMRLARIKEPQLKLALELIQGLDPRPGGNIATNNTSYVVPDVFVSKCNNRWMVELNPDTAPKIRINDGYASLIRRADNSRDNSFLKDNLQEARWFLKSLESRNETLLKVATDIVQHQQGFLEYGDEAMKPLVLHDIAESVGMHESTISRVTTQKFMHTPRGIYELKYFFSSHVNTTSGGECSSTAIRALIKKLVAAEDAKKPLSDNKIAELLKEQGIKVARRTIAKYRESLSIPPSNERKQLI
ncbi:RNA polymerase factor sigma-54 [Pelagibaculum spongiae]|uniref:RNA polymerase sigma-54 factor n=1 Tax=Pelagibaculum spongiae TaxID=2080658 RepID=A0A2V1H672_9GAMM|nr:RNA polymerase factor sigma-54 [Pelagibaculum spongiae]PVZ71922.1 RNA polymerase factor sigma-54 [Pelagibaculum spongiae]